MENATCYFANTTVVMSRIGQDYTLNFKYLTNLQKLSTNIYNQEVELFESYFSGVGLEKHLEAAEGLRERERERGGNEAGMSTTEYHNCNNSASVCRRLEM